MRKKKGKPERLSLKFGLFRKLNAENINQFLHGSGTFLQGGAFFVGQRNFNDLFNSVLAEFAGNADEQIVDAVFAFEINGARQNFLFVLQNRFRPLHSF